MGVILGKSLQKMEKWEDTPFHTVYCLSLVAFTFSDTLFWPREDGRTDGREASFSEKWKGEWIMARKVWEMCKPNGFYINYSKGIKDGIIFGFGIWIE
jgi:hypothetical protein